MCVIARAVCKVLELTGHILATIILSLSFGLINFCPPQLENGPHAPVYQLLNLFAYGTYCDYKGIAVAMVFLKK
jgi:hypothetical protein